MSERKTPEEIMDELYEKYEAVQRLPTIERQDRSLSLTYRDWMELRQSKYWPAIYPDARNANPEFCGLPVKILWSLED